MLDLYKVGKTKLKLNYLLNSNQHCIDIYLCIPNNHLVANKEKIEGNHWLCSGLITKRRYYSHTLSLRVFKNLLTDLISSDSTKSIPKINCALNNLWHQYKLTLAKEVKLLQNGDASLPIDDFYQSIVDIQRIFERHLSKPNTCFNDFEDLINWHCYQSLQRLIIDISNNRKYALEKIQPLLKSLVTHLHERRKLMGYKTPETSHQLSHLFESNSRKKRALRFTLITQEKMISINYLYQLCILGISAATAMLGLYSLLAFVGNDGQQVTLPILSAIAIGYGVREIFKEGIKKNLGSFFKNHFFSWKRIVQDGISNKVIMTQLIAFHWINAGKLKKINRFAKDHALSNHQVLHYRSRSKLHHINIPKGYDGLEESVILDFRGFFSQLLPNKEPILLLQPNTSDIKKIQAIFKCYLIIMFDGTEKQQNLVELHINKDQIINLTIQEDIYKNKTSIRQAG